VSRDQLLGRARRAVLAVAGTAGALGGRAQRRQADRESAGRQESAPRPAPTPGLPPRIDREPTAGLPPRITREPTPGLPPRITREPTPGLPPRIEREPHAQAETAAPPVATPPAVPEPEATPEPEPIPEPEPEPVYQPQHAAVPVLEQPDPAPYPQAPSLQPDPLRSPVRTALRSHLWLTGIVLAVLAVGASGYWVLRVHQRIGEGTLEHQLAKREHAPTVHCSSLQSDGAAWACGVIYQAESVCLIAKVNALGSWSTVVGQHRCERVPELEALRPKTPTFTAVQADIAHQTGHTDFRCRKLTGHKVRWLCGRPPAPGGQCLIVRVVPWTSWNETDGGRACDHFPILQQALRSEAAAKG
jgi:hypothetical protein